LPLYSHSRLSSYENCPLQYKYRYIDRIRTDFESIEAFMGKKVHETLEVVYADLDRAREAGVEEIATLFHRRWNDGLTSSVKVIRPDMKTDDYLEIGERCVRGFWELNYPFRIDKEKIIGLEYRVDIALDKERRHRMMGFIDRVQHAEPGTIEIHDYKTSAKLPWKGSLADDRQLPLYEMGIRQRFPQTERVRLIWHYLAHQETFTETRTREQLDRTRRSCIALIQTVERVTDYPAKKGPLCAWCSYQEMCPEWKDAKPTASPAYPQGRPEEAPGPIPAAEAGADRADAVRTEAAPASPGGAATESPAGDKAVAAADPPPDAEPSTAAGAGAGEAGPDGSRGRPGGEGEKGREDASGVWSSPRQLSLF
jgi:putative RecB family exonuclease